MSDAEISFPPRGGTFVPPESKFADPDQPRRPVIRDRNALKLYEQVRRTWCIKLPKDVTPHDLLLRETWLPVANKVQRHDTIMALAYDESWEAELRVEHSMPDGIEVSIWSKKSRKPLAIRSTILGNGRATTAYVDGAWCVLRTSDGYAEIRGEATEGAAISRWLREQPRKV